MLIPDFSAVKGLTARDRLDLTWADEQLYINNQPVEEWLANHDAQVSDLPRLWVPRGSLAIGYSLSREERIDEQRKEQRAAGPAELGAGLGLSDGGSAQRERDDGRDPEGGAQGEAVGIPQNDRGHAGGDIRDIEADVREDGLAEAENPSANGPSSQPATQFEVSDRDESQGVPVQDIPVTEFSANPSEQQDPLIPQGDVPAESAESPEPAVPAQVYPVQDFSISKEEMANFERRVYVGDKAKARNNLAAIRLLKHLNENHSIGQYGLSPDEQATLSAYVGWGGLPKAFRDPSTGEVASGWEDIVEEMESLLSDEDLKAARRSTLDAHYTAVNVVSAMWDGIEAAGFKGGAVMEPSMGTGLFFALQPESMKAASQRFGIEMDATSARISKWLYPQSRVNAMPFQDVNDLQGMMDVVIGNPPFGDQPIFDSVHPEWSEDAPNIHDYFFRKGLEQLQPGGVQAFVVSRFFLDAGGPEQTGFRQRIHRDAELLTAVRLPRTAFMANAGTQVVTDVIFLRKRMEPLQIDDKTVYPDWVSADGIIGQDPNSGRGVPGNRYYEKHPDHLMGIPALIRGMYREDEPAILPDKSNDADLGDRIRSVIVPELASKNLVWPESRLLAEARWERENRLYPVTKGMRERAPTGSFIMVHADPVVAREEHGFEFANDEDREAVQKRLDALYPPKLAVRTADYRGFAFAEEVMVPVVAKKAAKNAEDAADADLPEEDVDDVDTVQGGSVDAKTPMKRAFSDTEIQRIIGMVRIRDALQLLLSAQTNDRMTDADVEDRRQALNEAYDAFTKKYGLLNRPINRRVFRQDTFSGALQALEKNYLPEISAAVSRRTGEDPRPESAEKVSLFTVRTQYPPRIQDKAENPQDALRLSLSQLGRVDPVFIQSSLRDTEWAGDWSGIRETLKDEIYLDLDAVVDSEFWNTPSIAWPYQEKALALSGDILDKSERVQNLLSRMQGMDVHVGIDEVSRLQESLNLVRPQNVPIKDIGVRFGASWVGSDIYARFAKEVMGAIGEPVFHYEEALAKWDISATFPPEQEVRWGVQNFKSLHWVLSKTLNRQPLLVVEKLRDGTTVVREKETEIARQKSQEIQKEWTKWVYSNEEVGEQLEKAYNQTFNRFVPPRYDGRHLDLIGSSSAITLRPHQKNAIWRGMQSGKTFFDHAVGAGKTFAAVGLAMEMRRLGRAKKPMFVVPNHLVDQWRSAFLELYPSSVVLTATSSDMNGKNRQVFLGKAAYGDWDAVIIPHSSFSKIPPDPYWSSVVMEEEISGFENAIRALQQSENADKRTIKQLERKVERIKSKIAKEQSNTGRKDAGLTMGDIGVDFLFVDEVQEFKNLPYITEMRNVAGLGNPEGSAKAQDLYIKARSIQKMRPDHGGVVYLSGTPLSNTMAELYTWMRHFAYEEMERMGILHFDAWQNAFADVTRDYAFTMTGQYKEKAYLSVFDNLPELRALTQQFMDTISITDVRRMLAEEGMPDMPIPPIAGGRPNVVVCQPTRDQQSYIGIEVGENEDGTPKFNEGSILDRLDHLPSRPGKGEDNILSLSGEMSKVGLDLRAVTGRDNGKGDADNGMKLIRCADEIAKLYARWSEDRGTQLVFLDFSTPVASSRKGGARARKPSASEQAILDALAAVRRYEQDLEDFGEADDALQQKAESAQELLENISPQELEDVENKYLSGGERWSAYDALRRMLVERGIPDEEIAFIHDYEKPQEKAELFGMMRSGKMRVLMGSSSKMGAGMNVQDRLVGLHHLDAPYRPLDIEQRNGRGLRQGNKLLEKYGPEKFEMSVNYYVTEGAGDAGRWQILEFKKKFIDQYAQRNNGVRRVEDPSSQALDPARIKAESSGSDILMDKTVLSDLSKRLRSAESAWHNSLSELRRFMQNSEASIKDLTQRLPFAQEAARFSQDWLNRVDERSAALEEERNAAKELRKAEREAKQAKKGASEDGGLAGGDLFGEAGESSAEGAAHHSDTRGALDYRVATAIDGEGLPVLTDRQDCRISDMGADVVKITSDMLKQSLQDMVSGRFHTFYSATIGMVDVPLLKIGDAGRELTLVIEDVSWPTSRGNRIPKLDDEIQVSACWLAPDGKPVSQFSFIEKVSFLHALDGKEGPRLLRDKGTGIGSRILNSIKSITKAPQNFRRSLERETESLAAYQKEYDRLTLRDDGTRVEDFPQQNRLMLVEIANSCMDTALKGGLRKSADMDDRLKTLQENRDAIYQRIEEARRKMAQQAGENAEGTTDGTETHEKAADPMLERIELNIERLQSVAAEIRYWAEHREDIVEQLKDEQSGDEAFASILADMQKHGADMESLPYDEGQILGDDVRHHPRDDLQEAFA
jgi:N12 class adenine-specific DNA methylase